MRLEPQTLLVLHNYAASSRTLDDRQPKVPQNQGIGKKFGKLLGLDFDRSAIARAPVNAGVTWG